MPLKGKDHNFLQTNLTPANERESCFNPSDFLITQSQQWIELTELQIPSKARDVVLRMWCEYDVRKKRSFDYLQNVYPLPGQWMMAHLKDKGTVWIMQKREQMMIPWNKRMCAYRLTPILQKMRGGSDWRVRRRFWRRKLFQKANQRYVTHVSPTKRFLVDGKTHSRTDNA